MFVSSLLSEVSLLSEKKKNFLHAYHQLASLVLLSAVRTLDVPGLPSDRSTSSFPSGYLHISPSENFHGLVSLSLSLSLSSTRVDTCVSSLLCSSACSSSLVFCLLFSHFLNFTLLRLPFLFFLCVSRVVLLSSQKIVSLFLLLPGTLFFCLSLSLLKRVLCYSSSSSHFMYFFPSFLAREIRRHFFFSLFHLSSRSSVLGVFMLASSSRLQLLFSLLASQVS